MRQLRLMHTGDTPTLVLDNARIHHANIIQSLIKTCGVNIVYLSPYSPSLNPTENLF